MENEEMTPLGENDSSTPKGSKISNVWKYFVQIEPGQYMCKKCKENNPNYNLIMKKNSHASTTNFWRHLEVHHIPMFEELKGKSSGTKQKSMGDFYQSEDKEFLSGDAWTLDNNIAFLGITVHWIDDNWKLRERVLSLQHLVGEHTGENLSEALLKVLNEFSLKDKVCALTTDNASNNNTMVDAMIRSLSNVNPSFDKQRHMPCLAHVLNLVVQDGLKELKVSPTPRDNEDGENVPLPCIRSSRSLGDVVGRVRQVVKAIHQSPLRKEQCEEICKDTGHSTTMISLDISTRWNSTYDMLLAAHEKRTVLKKVIMYVLKDITGAHYLITEDEWLLVSDFINILEPFREVTQVLCRSKWVTASKALLLIQELVTTMKEHEISLNEGLMLRRGDILDDGQRRTISVICQAMVTKLEKYKEKLHGSNAFAIAMVLDPRLKFNHIPLIEGDRLRTYIRMLMYAVDDRGSMGLGAQRNVEDDSSPQGPQRKKTKGLKILERVEQLKEPSSTPVIPCNEELQTYLQQSTVKEDPLVYWKREGNRAFPKLCLVAKAFLAVCATSAPAERFFSAGKDAVTDKRNRLNAESISTLMTLKCWLQQQAAEYKDEHKDDELTIIEEDEPLSEDDAMDEW